MGLAMNFDFVRTTHGLAMLGQVVLSVAGGILNIFLGTGFLGFIFWTTFFISASLLLLHILNAAQTLENSFPYLTKIELGYAALWGLFTIIASILAFMSVISLLPALVGLALALAFAVDAVFKYRNYREKMIEPAGQAAAEAGQTVN